MTVILEHQISAPTGIGVRSGTKANEYAGYVRNPQTGVYENPTFDQDFTSGADHNVGDYHPFTKFMEI